MNPCELAGEKGRTRDQETTSPERERGPALEEGTRSRGQGIVSSLVFRGLGVS